MTGFLLLMAAGIPSHAQGKPDSLAVSLITCAPGQEIYELCGHSALRIRGIDRETRNVTFDSVWNYGLFSFDQPNFVYRFVKGETDYRVAGYPFRWFMPEYMQAGRTVTEQDLNLTDAEKEKLRRLLQIESLPENCVYRYNYVKDNCSTRIVQRISDASAQKIIFPDTVAYGTFRNEMRHFHEGYPWYQFGIDIALGKGLDYPLTPDEELFVPTVLMERMSDAKWSDGTPVVSGSRVLFQGKEHPQLPPTPWYAIPLFWAWVAFALTLGIVWIQAKRHKIMPSVYTLWFLLTGLAGILVTFLVCVSTHEASSPNALILWLNPLGLYLAVAVWFRKCEKINAFLFLCIVAAAIALLMIWLISTPCPNAAFFPLLGITLLLAGQYAIIYFHWLFKTNEDRDIRQ